MSAVPSNLGINFKQIQKKEDDQEAATPEQPQFTQEEIDTANSAAYDIDPMMKYLNAINEEHLSSRDVETIENVFSEFTMAGLGNLDKKKAQYAYEKLFDQWDVDLTGSQE